MHTHTCTRVALRRDHGGHVYDDRDDLGNYSWVALTGKYDSGNILDADDELEKTGTYALCFARYSGEENCTTWVPENYTFMPDVQIHIRHKPPSTQLALEPYTAQAACAHCHSFSRARVIVFFGRHAAAAASATFAAALAAAAFAAAATYWRPTRT